MKDEIRKEIDYILEDIDANTFIAQNIISNDKIEINRRQIDYTSELNIVTQNAVNTIDKLFKFYLTQEIINEEEYLKLKQHTVTQTLQQLSFMLKTGQEIIIKLMQTIDAGEDAPRMFEVLATLQKSQLEIIQKYSTYLSHAEEEVKKIRIDAIQNKKIKGEVSEAEINNNENNKGILSNDERKMQKMIQEVILESEINKKDLSTVKKEVAEARIKNTPEIVKQKITAEIQAVDSIDFNELDEY